MLLGSLGECCKLHQRGLEQSSSGNRIWCILAWKSDIWWHQFFIFPWPFPDHSNSLTSSSFPWPVGTLNTVGQFRLPIKSANKNLLLYTTLKLSKKKTINKNNLVIRTKLPVCCQITIHRSQSWYQAKWNVKKCTNKIRTRTNMNYQATCHLAVYGSSVTQRNAEPMATRPADDRHAQRKPVTTIIIINTPSMLARLERPAIYFNGFLCWCSALMLFCCMTVCRQLTARTDDRTHLCIA